MGRAFPCCHASRDTGERTMKKKLEATLIAYAKCLEVMLNTHAQLKRRSCSRVALREKLEKDIAAIRQAHGFACITGEPEIIDKLTLRVARPCGLEVRDGQLVAK